MKQKLSFKYCFCGRPITKNYTIEARFAAKIKNEKDEIVSFDKNILEMRRIWNEKRSD